jgi:bifunctional DNase/RNase
MTSRRRRRAHSRVSPRRRVLGSLFIESNGRVIELDSRASDAIAMALGDHAPIYCSKRLLEQDGVKRDAPPP